MGKTETGKMFSDLGLPLYDADAAVHKLYGPGQKGSEKVKKKFPNAINSDGSVNRESLSKEVLEDPEKIKILEKHHILPNLSLQVFLLPQFAHRVLTGLCNNPSYLNLRHLGPPPFYNLQS